MRVLCYHLGMETEIFFTVQEAAERIGVTANAIRNATLDGRLPFEQKYGRKVIAAAELEAYRLRSQPEGEKRSGRPRKFKAAAAQE